MAFTYQNTTLAPATSPLTTNARDPALTAVGAVADVDLRLDANAHAEVKLKGGSGQSERGSDIVIVEVVQKIVRRDPVLHGGLVARALEQMLALAGRVLRTNLVAVDTFGGQALVTLLGLELDEGSMDLSKRDLGQIGVGLLSLLPLCGRSAGSTRHGTDVLGNRGTGAMRSARSIDTSIGSEAQVGVLVGIQRGGLGIDAGRADISGGLVLVRSLVTGVQVGVVTAIVRTGTVAMTAGTTVGNIAVASRDVAGAIMALRMLLQRLLDGSTGLGMLGEVLLALGEMLLLSGGVLRADLVAEEALD